MEPMTQHMQKQFTKLYHWVCTAKNEPILLQPNVADNVHSQPHNFQINYVITTQLVIDCWMFTLGSMMYIDSRVISDRLSDYSLVSDWLLDAYTKQHAKQGTA